MFIFINDSCFSWDFDWLATIIHTLILPIIFNEECSCD